MRGLQERHSGYAGSPIEWRRFLACWFAEEVRNEGDGVSALRILKKDVSESPSSNDEAAVAELKTAEQRLGFELPPSA